MNEEVLLEGLSIEELEERAEFAAVAVEQAQLADANANYWTDGCSCWF